MILQRWFERGMVEPWRVATDRLRAGMFALRGARVGVKVRIGIRSVIQRPWAVRLGDRSVIEQDVFLKIVDDSAALVVGSDSFIGRGTEFDVSKSVTIGCHTLIAPGCFITDHTHRMQSGLRIDLQGCTAQRVFIGDDVWIGAQSVILNGATIGDGAVVGAHSVVKGEIPAMAIAVGAPARIVGKRC